MSDPHPHLPTRRDMLQLGALGLTLPGVLAMQRRAPAAANTSGGVGFGKAKRCIVLFAWGGMSHLDTFDMKPDAPANIRGQFSEIKTSTKGVRISEHLPRLAKQTHRMAIVRSAHHNAPSHRSGAYWNLTGHEPPNLTGNWEATRKDWPCIGSMVSAARDTRKNAIRGALPGVVCLPYPMYDGGDANGQDGGFLGLTYDPVIVRPDSGKPYNGKSPDVGWIDLSLPDGVTKKRFVSRRGLLGSLGAPRDRVGTPEDVASASRYHEQAMNMLLSSTVRKAFDLDTEAPALRQAYGDHICGQSVLMARKLTEAGVPLVTVYCAAGDLNGSKGAHFDTHGDNFNKLKRDMLPPLDRASAALLNDLHDRSTLDETLVVWLTEFGRTPKINGGAGRDHYPNCYSVAFAGGGIAGGRVYGSSDRNGAFPASDACGPADLHATIFHALGINPKFMINDMSDRPLQICDGKALPLFG